MDGNPIFKSRAFESIHSSAKALSEVGAISEETLREFDVACRKDMPDPLPDEHVVVTTLPNS